MKVFHCGDCQSLLFFENVQCLACQAQARLPAGSRRHRLPRSGRRGPYGGRSSRNPAAPAYRLCENYFKENVCNWAVPADDSNPYCLSCRLTGVIPDLGVPGHRESWCKLETAKRRLIYTLLSLGLPLAGKAEAPQRA